ncbi:MAG: radical SAM protein [Mariprofundaceae bacterium]|nr:radical SAM protein [Mariprofundaceae bacterium]
MLNIHEIYTSVQGESTLVGTPCTFVRLAGCPLHCTYCDTLDAIPFDSGQAMSISDIVEQVRLLSNPLVLVTGGEPLAQKACIRLLEQLCDIVPMVQLETSGALDTTSVPKAVRKIIDVKTPGSGEAGHNRWSNFKCLEPHDEVKFVLTSRADYEWSRDVLQKTFHDVSATVLFSPCWESLNPADLCAWILEDHLPVRLQVQMHKVIWGKDKKGV